jgi:hypothetical protein
MKLPQRLCEVCVKENRDLFGTKLDLCGSPTPSSVMRGSEVQDMSIFFKNAVNDPLERSGPFAVYDPDMTDSLAAALSEVFRHKVFHVFGIERMQVQYSIDRDLNRIIFRHLYKLYNGLCNRIEWLQEGKSMEISVSGINPFDPMLLHQYRCLGIM